MRLSWFLALLFILVTINYSTAQRIEDVAEEGADALCDCVNETYGHIDEDVKKAIITLFSIGMEEGADQEEAVEQYMAGLSPDLLTRIQEQTKLLEGEDQLFTRCIENVEHSLMDYTANSDAPEISEDAFLELLMNNMENAEGCEFAYFLMGVTLLEHHGDVHENSASSVESTTAKRPLNEQYHGTGGN